MLAKRLDHLYSAEILLERTRLSLREWILASMLGLTWVIAAAIAEDLREFALLAFFSIPFIVVSVTDIEARIIPNRVVYPFMVLALALSWAWPDRGALEAILGAAAGFGFILLPFVLSGGHGIAAGDVKLAALIGAAAGWPAVIAGLLVGVVAGGIAAVAVGLRARSRTASFAYGPYLALGGVIALLAGEDIIDWYAG